MKCRLAIVCLLAMALPSALLLAIWPDEAPAPEAVRAPDALPRDMQAPVEPVLPPALAPVQLPTLEEISARTAPAPPGDPPAPTAPDVAPAAVVPSDLPAASEETRPFHFSGRVTYADGSPVAVGTVTLSFYAQSEIHPPTSWRQQWTPRPPPSTPDEARAREQERERRRRSPWNYSRIRLSGDWTADLAGGSFRGEVVLRTPKESETRRYTWWPGDWVVEIVIQRPRFSDVSAFAPIRELREAVLVGDFRSHLPTFAAVAATPDPPLEVVAPPLAGAVDDRGAAGEPVPPLPQTLVVGRGARLTVLLPRVLTGPGFEEEPPAQDAPESGVGPGIFLVRPGKHISAKPGAAYRGAVVDRGDHWAITFPPVSPDPHTITWVDQRDRAGDWTRLERGGDNINVGVGPSYGPLPLEQDSEPVLDLRTRDCGVLTGMLLDAKGRPWEQPAVLEWWPSGDDRRACPAHFREAGRYHLAPAGGRFFIPFLLPGSYELTVSVGTGDYSKDVARRSVIIEDGRGADPRIQFERDVRDVVVARVEWADGALPAPWRLQRFDVISEGTSADGPWRWHWPQARFRADGDDRVVVLPCSYPDGKGSAESEEAGAADVRGATVAFAPAWWRTHPAYQPGRWLLGPWSPRAGNIWFIYQEDISLEDPISLQECLDEHETVDADKPLVFFSRPAWTKHGFLLRATTDDGRSAVQYFPVGVPDEALVFRLGP